jgi:hypothetical protein
MKVIYCLLIIILASLYKAIDERPKYCNQWTGIYAPTDPSNCSDLWINISTFYTDPIIYYKCCYENRQYYLNGKYTNITQCAPVTREKYDTLIQREKSGIDYLKTNGAVLDKYEFNCSSNYLYLSLLSLIIFLL